MDLQKLVDKMDKTKLYHYQGSLTTPPCSEVVEWLVLNDPEPMSQAQFDIFNKRWAGNATFARGNGNNRVVQPLNGRTIYFYSGASHIMVALFTTSLMIIGSLFAF